MSTVMTNAYFFRMRRFLLTLDTIDILCILYLNFSYFIQIFISQTNKMMFNILYT